MPSGDARTDNHGSVIAVQSFPTMTNHVTETNIEAYQIMAEMLVTVRRIVHRGLEKAAGKTWYLDGCPPGIYERLVARKENEVAIDRFDREYQELISFASLDDLADIVEYNDDLAHLLEGIAPDNATMAERFRQIETLRLKLEATVPFDDDDLETLIGYQTEFRQSLAKPKKKAAPDEKIEEAPEPVEEPMAAEEVPTEMEENAPSSVEAVEPSDDFGTKVTDVDELGADDVVSDDVSGDFGTAVVDSGVIEAPAEDEAPEELTAPIGDDEAAVEAERAIAGDDDGEVLRVLHREIMAVAEHVLKGDVDQEFPAWHTIKSSGWYDLKITSLALASIELFYKVAEELRAKNRAGESKEEIKAYLKEAEVSKLLLSLSETFKRHNL